MKWDKYDQCSVGSAST